MEGDPNTLGGDSDLESPGDMDLEALQHAGIWTDTETLRMHIGHLSKLKVGPEWEIFMKLPTFTLRILIS